MNSRTWIFFKRRTTPEEAKKLDEEIVSCRLNLRICADEVSREANEQKHTVRMLNQLFATYSAVIKFFNDNRRDLYSALLNDESTHKQSMLFLEQKIAALEQEAALIKLKISENRVALSGSHQGHRIQHP